MQATPRSLVSLAPPDLAAEVEFDRIPELLGEIERLWAVLWARLAPHDPSTSPGSSS